MYIVRDYMTNEIVAYASRKEDAVTMTTGSRRKDEPVLIYEKSK